MSAVARWRAPRPTRVLDPLDRAWVAGLIEGEGSYYLRDHTTYPAVVFQLNMTDEDVVRRAQEVAGVGKVNPHAPGVRSVKQQWRWRVAAQAEVAWLMDEMYPLMGLRRKQKIDELRAFLPDWTEARA